MFNYCLYLLEFVPRALKGLEPIHSKKKALHFMQNFLFVGVTGFEPVTLCL